MNKQEQVNALAKFRLLSEHRIFVASIQGGLYGLSTHPTDKPLNECLISPKSMEKLKNVYAQVIKERQRLDEAMANLEPIIKSAIP